VVGGAVQIAVAFNLGLARMAGPYGVQNAFVAGSSGGPHRPLMMRCGNAQRRQVPIPNPLRAGTCRPLPLGPPLSEERAS
jgi:hypothetical protein